MNFKSAVKPTLYFIGVTTGQSSIMRVFPEWARFLNLRDAAIRGMDFPLHASPDSYREAITFIKNDPLSMGALVTTHKLDLFAACKDMFEIIGEHAALMNEVSCLSKRGDQLICDAKDPISSGLTMDSFLPQNQFKDNDSSLFCMGAGGSAIAISWHLLQQSRPSNRPSRVVVSDPSQQRLDHIQAFHNNLNTDIPIDYVRVSGGTSNDHVLSQLPMGSLVVNATGLGKDAPGSPLTDAALFPEQSIVWDLNYRGELVFLDQARVQQKARGLHIVDGWTYFIHGWTQAIAEVFHVTIPTSGAEFDRLSDIALEYGKPDS